MDKSIEICRNLKNTIDKMDNVGATIGETAVRGNGIWTAVRASKSSLVNKLNYIIKKNNITHEQIK
jgi:hypothetical protein